MRLPPCWPGLLPATANLVRPAAPENDLDPEVWVMTPGRGDVFGFVMNKRQGFFYPWPEPRAPKSAPAAAARRQRLHRPDLARLSELAPRRPVTKNPSPPEPVRSDRGQRHVRQKIGALEHLEHNPIWWRPDDGPRPRSPADRKPRSDHPPETRRRREIARLNAAQRLAQAMVERSAYVVPVTAHPDLELAAPATADWERFEPHVDRVHAPHNILAWDRHYAAN